jgi:hypothetical protein
MEDGWKNKWNKVKKTKSISEAALKYLNVYIGRSGKLAFGEDAERLSVITNLASIMYSILMDSYIGFTKLKEQRVVEFLEEDMLLNPNVTEDEYIDEVHDRFAGWYHNLGKEPEW